MQQRAAELIDRIGILRRAARRAAAAEAGVSAAQLDALEYLAACNRFSDTPAAVAEYLDATRGTISQSLLALERKGLVTRAPDARDGRVHHLRPTPAGVDVLGRVARDEVARAAEGLGADTEGLEGLLTRVLREAQRARGGRAFGRCAECRHLLGEPGGWRCGLTAEPLSAHDTTLLCVEHEERVPAS